MGSGFRHPQLIFDTTTHHLFSMFDEILQDTLEIQKTRLNAIHQGDQIETERALEIGVLVKLIQDLFREGILLQLHHHANLITTGLIANVGNAHEFLIAH